VSSISLRAGSSSRRDFQVPSYPCRSPVQLDVFTLVPHAFAWLTEQRPVATVLGTELDLRLFSYRDSTPMRAAQVDDEPYGGGAGMVLRVDVVAAALDAVYEGVPNQRVIALSPQGRQLTQDVVEELADEERLTLLSARSTTKACGASPQRSCRSPTMATSCTAGWRNSTPSTSTEEMFSPPLIITSFKRSRISM